MRNLMVAVDRIAADIETLAALTEAGQPWTRRSFTPMFDRGRAWVRAAMEQAGLAVTLDAGGNMLGRRPGTQPGLGTIMVGSHTDTVPSGGRFDGVAGVVTGMEIARSLHERGIRLRHDLVVVDFLAEEVSGFGVSCIGSRAMAGVLPPAWLERTWQDRRLAEAIGAVGGAASGLGAPLHGPLKAFIELHIEQGTILERSGTNLGLVSAIAGITRIELVVAGRADHAGTTPMDARADALVEAAGLVVAIDAEGRRPREGRHFTATVGEFEIEPGAANVIPNRVRMLIDARAEERADMEAFVAWVQQLAAGRALPVEMRVVSDAPPVAMDRGILDALAEAAEAAGISHRPMTSGAGHDAAYMARLGPAAMVFVPSLDGRSHTPEEWTDIADIALGAEAIARAVISIDAG